MNINLQLLLPKKWAWFKLISFVTFFTNDYYNYCCISITWREALLESRKDCTFILHWNSFLVRFKTLNKRKWMNLIMSNVPTNVKWKRERERKRGLNKWKTNLCFALSRKNLHLTTTIFTSYASHAFHVFWINNCCFIHEIISH